MAASNGAAADVTVLTVRCQHGLDVFEVSGPVGLARELYVQWREKMDQQDEADRAAFATTTAGSGLAPAGSIADMIRGHKLLS